MKLDQAALAQRIEGDDRHAALRASCSVVQHARAVACRRSGRRRRCSRSARSPRASPCRPPTPMLSGSADRRALVAHVRAVGQVVGAVQPREQRVHVRGLERRAARRRRTPPRSDRARFSSAPISAKASSQATGHVAVGRRRPSASGGSAGPAPRDRGRASSRARASVCAAKNSGGARAAVISQAVALAPFSQNSNGVRLGRLRPGAADAREAVGLVLPHHPGGAVALPSRVRPAPAT